MSNDDEINRVGAQLDSNRAGAAKPQRGGQLRLLRIDPRGQGVAIVEARRAIAELDGTKFNGREACRVAALLLRLAYGDVALANRTANSLTVSVRGGLDTMGELCDVAEDIRSLVKGIDPAYANKRKRAFAANRLWATCAAIPWINSIREDLIHDLEHYRIFQFSLENDEYFQIKYEELKTNPRMFSEFCKIYSGCISFWERLR